MNKFIHLIFSMCQPFFRWYGPIYAKNIQRKYSRAGKINKTLLRYAFAECGCNFNVNGSPLILAPEKIHVGDNFTINDGAQLCPHAKIFIGNNVTMSRGSQITSGGLDTSHWADNRLHPSGSKIPHVEKDVVIGDGTWLCINSVVLSGVRITGKGVIVAAGAVVTSDISDDFVVVGGIPARIVKRLS